MKFGKRKTVSILELISQQSLMMTSDQKTFCILTHPTTLVACGWAGAVMEKVTRASGQELYAQKARKR